MSAPPPDWQIQVSRAYAAFGVNPIATSIDDGVSVFAKWSHLVDALTPEERSKIAEGRTRSAKGTFEKERLKPGEILEGPEVRARIDVDPKTGRASPPKRDSVPSVEQVDIPETKIDVEATKKLQKVGEKVPDPAIDEFLKVDGSDDRYEEAKQAALAATREKLWTKESKKPGNTVATSTTPKGASFKEMEYEPPGTPESAQNVVTRNRITEKVLFDYRKYAQTEDNPMSMDEYLSVVSKGINRKVAERPHEVKVRTHGKNLPLIAESGSIKSTFEVKGGSSDPATRRPYERDGLGVPEDIPDHLRPISGWYGEDIPKTPGNELGIEAYGNVILTMKPEVLDRTTLTMSDSAKARAVGVPINDILNEEADIGDMIAMSGVDASPEFWFENEMKDKEAPYGGFGSTVGNYMETQIHGGLPTSDIGKITYESSDIRGPNTPSILDPIDHTKGKDYSEMSLQQKKSAAWQTVSSTLSGMGLISGSKEYEKFVFNESELGSEELGTELKAFMNKIIEMQENGEVFNITEVPGWDNIVQQFLAIRGMPDVEVEYTDTRKKKK